METEYSYTCPSCNNGCLVVESLTGQNVQCPSCSKEFYATPPEQDSSPPTDTSESNFALPEKLPFFKGGRRKILEQRFEQLLAAGSLTDSAQEELKNLATTLRLEQADLEKIYTDRFMAEFDPIKRRMESSFVMTDEDMEEISELKQKYGLQNFTMEGNAGLFRAIYLLESQAKLPPPQQTELMLDDGEMVYFSIPTTWHQVRVHNRGYSGTSLSVPTGLKGVRFRFGSYSPVRSEEITPLSNGVLYVTSKRLFFKGEARNVTIGLKKIVDGQVFADSLRVEKSTGKPDYFSMNAAQARYILSMVGVLK